MRPAEQQPPKSIDPRAIAYHIIFTTYGTWLHGDGRGSWDRHEERPLPPDELLRLRRFRQLQHRPMLLSEPMRTAVNAAIVKVCEHRDWKLFALNVRTNHVHIAVAAQAVPDKMLHDFKAYATRRLRREGLVSADTHVWTAKGRVKVIDHPDGLATLIDYILNRQGPL